MKIKISFHNQTEEDVEVFEDIVKLVIEEAIKAEGLSEGAACSFIFTTDEKMAHLNELYRGKASTTDVLTFGKTMGEDSLINSKGYLGDVFISMDTMREQAYEYGHGEIRELAFLAVHGFLHLLGYDHIDEKDAEIMFARQEAILDGKNIRR